MTIKDIQKLARVLYEKEYSTPSWNKSIEKEHYVNIVLSVLQAKDKSDIRYRFIRSIEKNFINNKD